MYFVAYWVSMMQNEVRARKFVPSYLQDGVFGATGNLKSYFVKYSERARKF